MRIYKMTATFGKLEQETLELTPGLNVIHAPNEWGKSTWCAFLVAMLYGLETRAKSTKTALADKERYTPWSGSPMAGRIDLHWNGRDITIERRSKGRTPMGEFRAYETESGLPVTQLNAANCGTMLLGVERSVFLRSGFIRLSDLPVTNDEALRRRLNALVTTGDESSAGDRLAQGLKDLRNRCRYNRTGLIPQVEAEMADVQATLEEIDMLRRQTETLRKRLEDVSRWIVLLENHRDALAFRAAEADAQRVAEARQIRDEAGQRLQELDALCGKLPNREQVRWGLAEITKLEQAVQALDMEAEMSAEIIERPVTPDFVGSRLPEQAVEKAVSDAVQYEKLTKKQPHWLIVSILLMIAGGVAAYWYLLPGLTAVSVGFVLLIVALTVNGGRKRSARDLAAFYGGGDPTEWVRQAKEYQSAMEKTAAALLRQQEIQRDLDQRRSKLEEKIHRMTNGKGLQVCRGDWEQALSRWDALSDVYRDYQRAESQLKTVKAMAKIAKPPRFADEMTYTAEETDRLLSDGGAQLRQIESRLSQYTGRIEALGDPKQLEKQLDALQERRKKLENTYAALTVAQDTLAQAKQELQRRFAPRISKRAGELMGKMTVGRYDRLQLGEDFSLLAGAEQETVLHEALWRSDGTVDQLYLALRLAVAEELAPAAPLILDDALVRFDDDRLKAALQILKEESESKQVILFSCQSREKNMT